MNAMENREAERTSAEPKPGANGTAIIEERPERTGPRKRYFAIAIGAIAVIALVLWGIRFFSYARTHESTDDARVDANVE